MTFHGFISYSHAADGRLAPAVQRGLHRLAKPWNRRRALWMFRDQTGLSVTPALWSSIQEALDRSDWFVLLASPEAARSAWVNREVEHWIATKPADRILPVLTDGEWRWDPELGDLSADSTAVPDALRGVFTEEPLFLDLRWTRDEPALTLGNARFRDAIAQLAAPMHGLSKDELEGEDVRQHRRARRLRRGAVAALALLTAVSSVTGVVAGHNADRATTAQVEAQRQEDLASRERGNAGRFAEEARRQQENARAQEARARAAAVETKTQEKQAREQRAAAERAAAEARRQQENARRQQELASRSRALAEEQQKVAREQRELAAQSAQESQRQRMIAERQQLLAAQAAAEAERQRTVARQQQRLAEESAAEARRQEAIARANEQKAKEAAAEARRQEENAAEQKRIALGRRLFNRAATMSVSEPATALRLGIAAEKIQPGAGARAELVALLAATRKLGGIDEVLAMAYGANDIMAVVGADYTLSLWNVAAPAAPVRLGTVDDFPVFSIMSFGPDGKTLAIVGGWDFQPILLDLSDPAAPVTVSTVPMPDAARTPVLSPDGRTLAVGDIDGIWTLWDMTDRESPAQLSRITGSLTPPTFSTDSRTVVTAGVSGAAPTVWDITDRTRPTALATLDGRVRKAAFSPVRPLLAVCDFDGNLTVWNMGDPAKPKKLSTQAARATDVTFSKAGTTLATSDKDGAARLWDMATDTPFHLADMDVGDDAALSLAFSPDGTVLATLGIGGSLSLWTVEAHGAPQSLGRVAGADKAAVMAALSSDGRRLITAQNDGTATTWDLSDPARPVERGTVPVTSTSLTAAAVSSRGDLIAAVGWAWEGYVTLTDLSDPGAPVTVGTVPFDSLESTLALSPDGRTLAVAEGATVVLWDLTDPRNPARLAEAVGGGPPGGPMVFSPDGGTLAVAVDRTVELWNLADRSKPVPAGRLKGHSAYVDSVAFSPDGRALATGALDKTAALWNIAGSVRRREAILPSTAFVDSVAFTPDGRTLVTGTGTGSPELTFWDVTEPSSPQRVSRLKRAEAESHSLLLHPDGHTLITSGTGRSAVRALVWDYSALNAIRAAPIEAVCAITGGGFTPDEWAAYVPEAPYQETCPR